MRRVLAGVWTLFRRRAAERELDEELHAFLDADVEARVEAGAPRDEAVRQARLSVGGSVEAVKDAVRDTGWESHLERVWTDTRIAVRKLRRSPGFAVVIVMTLALGIGANSAIFSIIDALLLRSLPVKAPERLVLVSTRSGAAEGVPAPWSYPEWNELRAQRDLFHGAVAWTMFAQPFDLATGGQQQLADGLFVSGNFFEELGVPLRLGRGFTAQEDVLGSPDSHVAVISYGFWQRRFGGAADAIGKRLTIDGVPITVIGVAPASFLGLEVGRAFDVALPIGAAPAVLNKSDWTAAGLQMLSVMFRLQTGQSANTVAAALRARQRLIVEASAPASFQKELLGDPFVLMPAAAGTSDLRRQYSRSLMTVQVIAGMVLLIACVNIANLLLARAAAGRHEMSVRRALGAPRWRIVQQQLVESLLISAGGAAVGLLFATWGSRLLASQFSTWFSRVSLDLSVDWRVLAFTATMAVVTALLFGTMPAIRASRVAPASALMRVSSGPDRVLRLRGGLVAVQVALSLVLVVAAALMIRSFVRLGAVPLGFDDGRVLVVDVNVGRAPQALDGGISFAERLRAVVRALPGVEQAAVSLATPFNHSVIALGAAFAPLSGVDLPRSERSVRANMVTPGWFETYGTRIVAGRALDADDERAKPAAIVVNEAFARKFLPGHSAAGATIVTDSAFGVQAIPYTIVGVAANVHDLSLREAPFPTVFFPMTQEWKPFGATIFLSVRTSSGSPARLSRSIATALTSVEPNLSFTFHLLSDQVDAARQQQRLLAWLSGFFGVLAIALAAIGMYGVTAYTVTRRRSEIGIRMALGALRRDVITLALRQTTLVILAGVAAGIVLAAGATRYLQALLFGVTPLDPVAFALAAGALVTVALAACYLPARRAATVSPVESLRCE